MSEIDFRKIGDWMTCTVRRQLQQMYTDAIHGLSRHSAMCLGDVHTPVNMPYRM